MRERLLLLKMKVNSYVLVFVGLYLNQIESISSVSCNSYPETQIINTIQEVGREISHAQWRKDPSNNVILSPLGIMIVLNLLMHATNGNANLEVRNALNFSTDIQEEIIQKTLKKIVESLTKSRSEFKVSLNTKLFPREGIEILDSFKDVSKDSYFTDIQNLDFQGSPTDATEEIDNWVSNITKGKSLKILQKHLSPDTYCVVYSIIFLDARWKNKFNTNLTKNGMFSTGKENFTIPMMTSEFRVPYVRNDKDGFEIISLPYEGNHYSMYILKPIGNSGIISKLIQVEDALNSSYLDSVISQMTIQKILVTIPRMKLIQNLDLKMDLMSIGINQIFRKNAAGLERFSDNKNLFVSNIFHRAFLEITEDGTSDDIVRKSTTSTSNPKMFILDKPSLLFVRNNENGLIIFWAKVLRPES